MAKTPLVRLSEIGPYSDENRNVIVGAPKSAVRSRILFRASNCRLELEDGVSLEDCAVLFDCDGGRCRIGKDSTYRGDIRVGLGCTVVIGSRLTVTKHCFVSTAEHTSVVIGDDCMFGSHNEIRADDGHPIFDLETGARVNPSQSIRIGDHVWLAARAVVLGGAEVGSGSVVGLGSVLTSSVPENSVAAGAPARVVKRGVAWQRQHLTLTPPHEFPRRDPADLEPHRGPVERLGRLLDK